MFDIKNNLKNILKYSLVAAKGIKNNIKNNEFEELFNTLIKQIKEQLPLSNLLLNRNAKEVRNLFKKIGLDPTKHRPSSEALFRRSHKDGFIPYINTAVAICNYCSLKYLIPIGCYDLDKIKPPLEIRMGLKDEKFLSLKLVEYNAEGKIILVDKEGICGSPIVDSIRTSVDFETINVALLFFYPISIENKIIEESINLSSLLLKKYAEAQEIIAQR